MEIITRKQAKALGLRKYYTGNVCINGHIAERRVDNRTCVVCLAAIRATWGAANPEKDAAYTRKWEKANPEKVKAADKIWNKANPEKRRSYVKKHNAAYPERANARSRNRKARKLRATPPWAHLFNDQYVGIYAEARDRGHEVDHIHPLRPRDKINGPYGLHVPWNLRIIPPTANRRKNNAMPEGRDAEISLWHACHSYIKIVEAAD